nr:UxaA family hydrolase [Escherichia coli]
MTSLKTSIKIITYLSDIGCLEIQGASLDSNDNLIVALKDLHAGESYSWDDDNITLVTDVKAKHKFATQDIPLDGIVSMYGTPVGKATRPIVKGEAITVDNIRHYAAPVTLEDVVMTPTY